MGMMFRGFSPPRAAIEAPEPPFSPSTSSQVDFAPTVPRAQPGFFDQGGAGRAIAGIVGDTLSSISGGRPSYAPMMLAQRQREQQAADERRRAALQMETWKAQRAYEQQHPDDQFTQYLTAAGIDPASSQGRGLYRQRAESMAAPPLMAVDGFDAQGNPTKTFVPRNGVGMGGEAAPAGPAIGTVKNGYRFQGGNPNDRNSWVPAGGASSGGGATFR